MRVGDLVVLSRDSLPVIGEVVSLTKKRLRIAIKQGAGYISVIRKTTTITLVKKARKLV